MKNCEICEVESSVGAVYDEELREIYLTGVVDMDVYQNVVSAIHHLDQTRGNITLIINSKGGEVAAGQGIADAIRLTKNKVIAHCFGECMSVAMTILQACDGRISAPNCRFMIHEVSGGVMEASVSDLKRYHAECESLNDSIKKDLAENSDLSLIEIDALCKAETFMSADVAMGYGFLDGIFGVCKKSMAKKPVSKKGKK
jgi:ATP-dependent Clp endopeptidase proteolytic subunit ClpP